MEWFDKMTTQYLYDYTTNEIVFTGAILSSILLGVVYLGYRNNIKLGYEYIKFRLQTLKYMLPRFKKRPKPVPMPEEEEFVFKDEDPNSNLEDGIKAKKILDEILEGKFEYYMYKEILPLYLGNQKKAPITNEKFKEFKNSFYQDIKLTLSPVLVRRLNYIFTPAGVGVYIHSKFATMFNKTDSKFVNKDNTLEKDNFFMS